MKIKRNVLYSFDSYTVEVAERRLWRDNELVSLTPKAFDTLVVLLEYKGRIVEKDVLLSEVWQNTFVEESTLAQNISTLRKTLGTLSSGTQFIETVPRHGYRFIADVKEVIGDEEIIVVEHHTRTQISAEHEKVSEEPVVQPETDLEKPAQKLSLTRTLIFWLQENKLRAAVFSLFFGLALTAFGIGVRYAFQPARLSLSRFNKIAVSKVTSNGNIHLVAISPDGKYLALVEKRGDNQTLLLRQIDNSTSIEIVPPKARQFIGINFSPDGQQIYFVTYETEKNAAQVGTLYKVPILGGVPQQIIADIDSPITISPDGRQFAFIRNYLNEKESSLMIAAFDKSDEKKLTSRRIREFFLPSGLAWSPDGKTIAAPAYKEGTQMDLVAVDTTSGEQKSLTTAETWQWVGQPNWLADGSGVIFPAFRGGSGNQTDEIWQVSYPSGELRKTTDSISGIYGLGLTADSKSMIAVKSERMSGFWTSKASDLKQANQITQNLTEFNVMLPGVNWTPDEKIVYGSTLNGDLDIWVMDADGSHKKQITTAPEADSMPIVSADGQNIFFISNRTGRRNIWQMKIDGSEEKQLTDEDDVSSFSLSEDGRTIFYTSVDKSSLQYFLHKVLADSGESVQMNSVITVLPQVSPDGKLIACYYPDNSIGGDYNNELRLTILSANNGEVVKQLNTLRRSNLTPIAWLNNQTFNYVVNEGGGSRLWQQSLDKREPKLIIDSPTNTIFRFAWSKNGQNLVYEKGTAINDVILIKSTEN